MAWVRLAWSPLRLWQNANHKPICVAGQFLRVLRVAGELARRISVVNTANKFAG
jgi:hypothetical protein